MSILQEITVQEYINFIDEQLNAYISDYTKRDESLPPSLLNLRKRHAQGLRAIILLPQTPAYVLLYDTRYIIKLVSQDFLTIAALNLHNPDIIKRGIIHYLLLKIHWFNVAPNYSNILPFDKVEEAYKFIEQSLPNVNSNPHVTFFSIRYKVLMFAKFDVSNIIPQNLLEQLPYSKQKPQYIMCYGNGQESTDINYQIEIYLQTLVQLLTPGITDAYKITIMCNQLTNEITNYNDENDQTEIKLDMHLVDEVRDIFENNTQLANELANMHLTKLLAIPNKLVGFKLAGYTASMLFQIFSQFELTAMSKEQYASFEESNHDIN